MKTDTQNFIIVGLTILALAFIFKDQFTYASMIAVGLVGFIAPRSLSDKQSDDIKNYYIEQLQKDENIET